MCGLEKLSEDMRFVYRLGPVRQLKSANRFPFTLLIPFV